MATLARKKTQLTVVRRKSPQIAKLKERLKSASRRARGQGGQVNKERTILTLAGAAGFAMLEKKGVRMPTVGGIDPAILIGAACVLAGPRYIGGKNGQRVQAIGDGVLSLAAARAVQRGGVKVSGTEIGYDDEVEVSGDDDDDLSTP
jgi:hypothetical protein